MARGLIRSNKKERPHGRSFLFRKGVGILAEMGFSCYT